MVCWNNYFDYKNYSQQRISSWATTMRWINLMNLSLGCKRWTNIWILLHSVQPPSLPFLSWSCRTEVRQLVPGTALSRLSCWSSVTHHQPPRVFMILLLEKSVPHATLEAEFLNSMVLSKCLWPWRRIEWDHWVMKGLQELRPKNISALKQGQWVFCLYLLQYRFKAIRDGQTTFKWKGS